MIAAVMLAVVTSTTPPCPRLPPDEPLGSQARAVACVLDRCASRLAEVVPAARRCETTRELAERERDAAIADAERVARQLERSQADRHWGRWVGPGIVGVGAGLAVGGTSGCDGCAGWMIAGGLIGTAGGLIWLLSEVAP